MFVPPGKMGVSSHVDPTNISAGPCPGSGMVISGKNLPEDPKDPSSPWKPVDCYGKCTMFHGIPWQTAKLLEGMSENRNSLTSTLHLRTSHFGKSRDRSCQEWTLQIHYEIKSHPKSSKIYIFNQAESSQKATLVPFSGDVRGKHREEPPGRQGLDRRSSRTSLLGFDISES